MITYKVIGIESIDKIKHLWEKNREFHEELSEFSKDIYREIKFEDKIDAIKKYDEEKIKITIAEDSLEDQVIGYVISSFSGKYGEVQTLHVLEKFRGDGIGRKLMEDHLGWLKNRGCQVITLMVSIENEKSINFYENLGFKSNTLEMRYTK